MLASDSARPVRPARCPSVKGHQLCYLGQVIGSCSTREWGMGNRRTEGQALVDATTHQSTLYILPQYPTRQVLLTLTLPGTWGPGQLLVVTPFLRNRRDIQRRTLTRVTWPASHSAEIMTPNRRAAGRSGRSGRVRSQHRGTRLAHRSPL